MKALKIHYDTYDRRTLARDVLFTAGGENNSFSIPLNIVNGFHVSLIQAIVIIPEH